MLYCVYFVLECTLYFHLNLKLPWTNGQGEYLFLVMCFLPFNFCSDRSSTLWHFLDLNSAQRQCFNARSKSHLCTMYIVQCTWSMHFEATHQSLRTSHNYINSTQIMIIYPPKSEHFSPKIDHHQQLLNIYPKSNRSLPKMVIYALFTSKCRESHLRAFVVKSTRVPGLG